jgi:hypothetical protein
MMENGRNVHSVQLSVAFLGVMNRSSWDLRCSRGGENSDCGLLGYDTLLCYNGYQHFVQFTLILISVTAGLQMWNCLWLYFYIVNITFLSCSCCIRRKFLLKNTNFREESATHPFLWSASTCSERLSEITHKKLYNLQVYLCETFPLALIFVTSVTS